MNGLNQTWNLDAIFPGGSSSAELEAFLDEVTTEIGAFRARLKNAEASSLVKAEDVKPIVDALQSIASKLKEARAFTGCLLAQNMKDKQAAIVSGKVANMAADYASALTLFDQLLTGIPESKWNDMVHTPGLQEVQFSLQERRALAAEKLSPEMESLISELSVDGYHAWNDLYNTTVSRMRIPFEENGSVKELSSGQFFNKLTPPDNALRADLFDKWEAAWAEQADFCAEALNHLAGFRLKVYNRRGWDSVHKEPLAINRMSKETLDMMWNVINRNKSVFVEYLNRKAKLLGKEKLDWNDVEAPVGEIGGTISYDEGANLIVDQFRQFSPRMADFSVKAFKERWIEAEDRAGKRPGGFCSSFPVAGQTRIFMTYSGTASNVSTLAHELGHGYHQHVMKEMPFLAQQYAMNVAETASTFAEMIVSDAVVKAAKTPAEKLNLLDDKISRSIAFFMNIHCRFIFETNFYEERRKGLVSVDKLNQLMVNAQKEAFCDSLSSYHPHFWAAKLHFYSTGVPFYNFPYTFGFLFSAGIYAEAIKEGASFEEKYAALLRDTASMSVENLAQKHLGIDLTKPDFWQAAVDLMVEDVKEFMQLADEVNAL